MTKEKNQKFQPLAVNCRLPSTVNVEFPGEKLSKGAEYVRFLYLKEHSIRKQQENDDNDEEHPESAILFVANVCPYWDEDDLDRLFSQFSSVEKVSFGKAQNCNFATVKFTKSSGLKKTLKRAAKAQIDESDFLVQKEESSNSILSCLKPSNFNVIAARESIDKYMEEFQKEEQAELERQKIRESQVDEDGFEVVSYKKSAKRKVLNMDSSELENIAKTKARVKKKSKEKELQNFYRFQMREAKREKLASLREKFEQDKLQIQRLKAARKFKPY